MTSIALSLDKNVTSSRACAVHGLCDDAKCARCGRATYDLTNSEERWRLKELRKLNKTTYRFWPYLGAFVFGCVPGFVEGLAQGSLMFEINLVPALVGFALGIAAGRFAQPMAARRLDEMLKKS